MDCLDVSIMDPLVSIIIPVYNAERYLGESIRSCQRQSYQNTEIIVVNDGSSDNSLFIAEDLAKSDCRISVLTQSNSGVNAARKFGVESCNGEWIMFLDSDDILLPNAVKTLIDHSSGYSLVSGLIRFIDEKGDLLDKYIPDLDEVTIGDGGLYIKQLLTDRRYKCVWRCIISRDVINLNAFDTPRELTVAEDFVTMVRIAQNISCYRGINEIVYHYRWYEGNTTNTTKKSILHIEMIFDMLLRSFENKEDFNAFENELYAAFFNIYVSAIAFSGVNRSKLARFLRRHIQCCSLLTLKRKAMLPLLLLPGIRLRVWYYNRLLSIKWK